MRWSLLVAAAVFLLLALLDFTSLPAPARTQVLALRLGLAWQDSPPTCPGRALHIAPGTCHFYGATVLMKRPRTRKKTRRDGNHRGALSEEQPCQRV
jgi:hypothetical protein